ncbi:MAG: NHL repeat-containing protein [Pseudomonadota bacterium]
MERNLTTANARVLAACLLSLAATAAFAQTAPEPLFTFGGSVEDDPLLFGFPTGIAVDDETGDIYVVDRNFERARRYDENGNFILEFPCKGCLGVEVNPVTRRVYVGRVDFETVEEWTTEGEFVRSWGSAGTGDGEFNDPRNLAIDPETNDIYVFDAKNARIQVFDQNANYLRQFGEQGDDPGQFRGGSGPYSIAFDPFSRTIVATDPQVNQIHRFDLEGNVVGFWDVTRSFGRGETRWIRDVEIDINGDVMIADSDNERIQSFTSEGEVSALFRGPHDTVVGSFHPRSVAVNRVTGKRYVMAAYAHRVDVFSADNEYEFSFGGREDFGLTLSTPGFLAVLPGSGDLVVVDEKNFLMKRFTGDGEFVSQWGTSSRIAATHDRANQPIMPFDASAIAVDVEGNLYHASSFTFYSDVGRKFVQKMNPDTGTLVDTWFEPDDGNNDRTGVAVDDVNGRVFISEPRVTRVGVYDPEGNLLDSIAIEGATGLAYGEDGLYVASRDCQCIRRYTPELEFDLEIGGPGDEPGQFAFEELSQIALDPEGVLYVADSANDRLQGFDRDGTFLWAYGERGGNFGQFRTPRGIAVSPAADRLYVTDAGNERIYAFALGRRGGL